MRRLLVLALLAAGCASPERSASAPTAILWLEWDDALFPRAHREGRPVILDLGATWCHWCHVMDRETYGDPEVVRIVSERFLAVRVDQDRRPDLAARYEDYGWPATIIFAPDGTELVKFRGYIAPVRMRGLLQAVADDPTPGPSALDAPRDADPGGGLMSAELERGLQTAWSQAYDAEHAGWGFVHKYLDPDCIELAIALGEHDRVRATLDAQRALVDPVWGGVYQYSDGGVWTNPHFEKIMAFQAANLRIYALAYRFYGDPKDLATALDVRRFLMDFLRAPDGAFYASVDADVVPGEHAAAYFARDDAGRRALGLPRVDTHRFARETGQAAAALAVLFRVTRDPADLDAARAAVRWALRERALDGGGFRHDETDAAGPFMSDTLALLRAFLELHEVTAEPEWLPLAVRAAGFIDRTFRAGSGFRSAAVPSGAENRAWAPAPQRDENIEFLRLSLRLAAHTGDPATRERASHALRFLASPATHRGQGLRGAGILLAALELRAEPDTVVVQGPKGDAGAEALHAEALRLPSLYLQVTREVSDAAPAAQLCRAGACASPAGTPEELRRSFSALNPGRRAADK